MVGTTGMHININISHIIIKKKIVNCEFEFDEDNVYINQVK